MKFMKTDDLKPGMRLAKPIYNKDGVLLYERNSALTSPGISSVKNFGLIGIYILEPAEPLPPFSREDQIFEQLQTVYMFKLRECVELIQKRKKLEPLHTFVNDIVKHYGRLDHRVNFNQNLRSGEDFMYKHSISMAILVTMMTAYLKYPVPKQLAMVTAALLYDIGYIYVPKPIMEKGSDELSAADRDLVQQSLERGLTSLAPYRNDYEYFPLALALMQNYVYADHPDKFALSNDKDIMGMINLLRVADQFDQMTAMNVGHEPVSEIAAMRSLKKDPKRYPTLYVSALAQCIHIVPHAANVDLSTGDTGIVLVENNIDFMRPIVLRLSNNTIYDLSQDDVYKEIQILDIMKTMDNRIAVDDETIKQFVPDPELQKMTQKMRSSRQKAAAKQTAAKSAAINAAMKNAAAKNSVSKNTAKKTVVKNIAK